MNIEDFEFLPSDYEGDDFIEMEIGDFFEKYDLSKQDEKTIYERFGFAVNIHFVLHSKNLAKAYEIVEQIKTDPRLEKLNAIVFLGLKNKGRGKNGFSKVPYEDYKKFANHALDSGINIGWDSCSCNKFLKAIEERENYEDIAMKCDPCESGCFSSYINVKGEFHPCSFCEGEASWETGIDVTNCNSFVKDVWNHPRVVEFRETLLKNNRNCPIYDI